MSYADSMRYLEEGLFSDYLEQFDYEGWIECQNCNGTGDVKTNSPYSDCDVVTCPACKGKGEVYSYELIEKERGL
jgi:DnaJ-class molecular chaperone